MDPALTPEQEAVRRTLRELLAKHSGPDEVRTASADPQGYDAELWHRLADQLGLPGLALPTAYGGIGLGPVELALACEESGRALLPSPLLASSVLASTAVRILGTGQQRAELLPALAGGARTGALITAAAPALALGLIPAGPGDGLPDGTTAGGGRAGGIQARPAPEGDGWLLYGEAGEALDGARADLLVVAAHTGGFPRSRTVLFLVEAASPGLARTRLAAMDDTRTLARVEFRDTPAVPLGDPERDASPGLARTGLYAALAVAAEAVGAAEQCLTRTVEYVQVRKQFGRAVGSFQAVKHRLADVYVAVETARSAVHYAAWTLERDEETGDRSGEGEAAAATAVPLALAHALESLRTAAADAVQLHGGIAITWEHDAQLYFKRAAADELLFGPPHLLRARAAELANLFGPTPVPVPVPAPVPTPAPVTVRQEA
ncbi:acyl-CoA dehydrogenase family protein [Streptacidiphilus carbonis]|uniref:acyl-CoA dehydrogenase family protein n=1 Tax=Streptacidiphilus carbonis TaxID=105422 RepID=UPI0007C72AA7|nr:acyl-CoA dehydrogenase family protein [Streptacidiphilus carbonis]